MEFFHIAYDRIRETNRYAVAAGVFLLWMLTLADVDLIRMVQTHQERLDIETKKRGTKRALLSSIPSFSA